MALADPILPSAASAPTEHGPLDPAEFEAAVAAVTNAFGDPTRRAIYLFVRDAAAGVKAADVAERFALHPNVARHHLEKLAAGGYLHVDLDRGESAGRPSKRYRANAYDSALTFPPRRDDLLATLLARTLAALPSHEASRIAEEVGEEYGVALASRIDPGRAGSASAQRSVRAAVATVADALTAHGFAAHAEERGDALRIITEHCPFGDAAREYPHVLCAVDKGMIRGMLRGLYGDADPQLEQRISDGDSHCVTRL